MLGRDYMKRHNKAVRCLHFLQCKKHGFKKTKKFKGSMFRKLQRIIQNLYQQIQDLYDIKVSHNKPNIFVFDKKKKEKFMQRLE